MKTSEEILRDAKGIQAKDILTEHLETINILRKKKFSWRDIAIFLNKRGIETDHSKIFRFIKKQRSAIMNTEQNLVVPTSDQYFKALSNITLTDNQKIMLGFHFNAHNRTVTFTELANAVNFENYNAVNLQYGKLGYLLGQELEMKFVKQKNGEDFCASSIGAGNLNKPKNDDFQLVMHHELAKAIEKIGWFND